MNLKKAAVVIGLAVFAGFGSQTVRADEDFVRSLFEAAPDDYIKTRSYVGVLGALTHIDADGDFNNSLRFRHDYSGRTEFNLVPSISRNFGFGGMVGYRTGAWAGEISFIVSEHESVWSNRFFNPTLPVTYFGVASYQSINLDFKRYLLTKYPAQPFFSLGVSFPWLVVKDGSLLDYGGGINYIDDATISGIGLNLGAGVEIYLGKDYSLVGGVVERFSGFNQINGATKQAANVLTMTGNTSEQGNLQGNGFNFYIAGTIGFE
jgi:hypothetical protein